MPLGFERINERTQRPNPLINFIKPLPGPTSETAELFLSRVAAICYPFMKKHMILVQALEEFPPNNEFIGRNFNAGEVIQLVLKDRRGNWLPMKSVQMVMVHELAHCKQMNHSKAFWKVRDEYAVELRGLWGREYTGDGMWGRGRTVLGEDIENGLLDNNLVPENLCGGTYGSRRRKRRRGGKEREQLSYAERKQRRILKKFGAGGKALGNDEDTRVKLENGAVKKGKPRVAGSARGRELRAAAALARFDQVKKEEAIVKEEPKIKEEPEDSGSETEDDYEEVNEGDAALDVDGTKMVDGKGHGLVRICEGEDDKDGNARRELEELQEFDTQKARQVAPPRKNASIKPAIQEKRMSDQKPEDNAQLRSSTSFNSAPSYVIRLDELYKRRPESSTSKAAESSKAPNTTKPTFECGVCSLVNEEESLTCIACSNVLNPDFVPDHWKCSSPSCLGSTYINAGDAGICGVCGTSRKRC